MLPSIRTATKSLDIVSPYLSPVYARLLLDKARQGIIVRLVTSDSNGQGHREALRMLGQKSVYSLSPRAWRYVILALLFGLVGAFTASYVGLALFVIAVVAIVAILAKNVTRRQTNSIPLFVKVLSIHQLVHVKLYVVDQQIALVGSANLTYSGMNRNIELIEEKSMPSEVQAEIGVFTQLWGSHHVPFIPPLRSPSVPQPVQSGLNTDDALTREDAETLDRLYGKKKPP